MVVIEHNLDVVACADWVIDIGPDGGEHGGEVVAAGTPEDIAAHPTSYTGRYLAPVLKRARTPAAKSAKPAKAKGKAAPLANGRRP